MSHRAVTLVDLGAEESLVQVLVLLRFPVSGLERFLPGILWKVGGPELDGAYILIGQFPGGEIYQWLSAMVTGWNLYVQRK